jgi:hypothetical protein
MAGIWFEEPERASREGMAERSFGLTDALARIFLQLARKICSCVQAILCEMIWSYLRRNGFCLRRRNLLDTRFNTRLRILAVTYLPESGKLILPGVEGKMPRKEKQ